MISPTHIPVGSGEATGNKDKKDTSEIALHSGAVAEVIPIRPKVKQEAVESISIANSPQYSEAFHWINSESPDTTEPTGREKIPEIGTYLYEHYRVTLAEAIELVRIWRNGEECDDSLSAAEIERIVSLEYRAAAAREHLRNGMRIFAVDPNGKKPAFVGWQYTAPRDHSRIPDWLTENPEYNIGTPTDELLVIDVDPKHGGSIDVLYGLGPLPDTQVSMTPSGGQHVMYDLPPGVRVGGSIGKLAAGIDVRSRGNLIVLPGSTINGRDYRWIEGCSPKERKRARAPDWLIELARAANKSRKKSAAAGKQLGDEIDPDWAIEAAEKYIREEAPDAHQSIRNNTAYAVCAKLFDWPLSKETVLDLAHRWNAEKCSPPLEDDEIAGRVDSAGVNRQNAKGVIGASSGFEAVEIDESRRPKGEEDESETEPFVSLATPFSFPDAATINPPDWIVKGLALRGRVSALTGPGGVSKSTWALLLAVATATGRKDMCGFEIPRRERVWVWNQEDSLDTMNARLLAILQEYGVSPHELLDENGKMRLFLNSGLGRKNRIKLVERKGEFPRPTKALARVIQTAAHEGCGLVILDPLVSLHEAKENSNEEMRTVFDHMADIAHDADCAVLAVCHPGKPDKKSSEGFAGDAYATRGASSQPDAARVAATLMSMSKEDAKKWSIPADRSHLQYARLDIAKINDGPKPSEPQWYWRKQIIVDGYRGDRLPVLTPVELEPKEGVSAEEMAAQIARAMKEHYAPETWVPVSDLLQHFSTGLRAALGGENRGRDLNRIFDFKQEVAAEGGVLKRATGKGRAGTKLCLSEMPHPSNASNPVEE
jgi:AAA domain/Bifunctional DNA primase/polymerase, N-terminal